MATTIKPLSGGQERRLREYLDDRFLAIQKGFSKRSDPTSTLRTLSSCLSGMEPLLPMIMLIPPVDPSASLRTAYLLRYTNDLLEAIPSYQLVGPPPIQEDSEVIPPVDVTLVQLFDATTVLDKAWRAVLLGQRWDPETKSGAESYVSTSGVTQTDRVRLHSLLVNRRESIYEWLDAGPVELPIGDAEEVANMFWRTFGELDIE